MNEILYDLINTRKVVSFIDNVIVGREMAEGYDELVEEVVRRLVLWQPLVKRPIATQAINLKAGCYDSRLKELSLETTLVLSNTRELDKVPSIE